MHHFRNAAFIEDNGKATNSPNYRYRLTDEMLHLIQSFGTADWERCLACFMENHDSLVDLYASKPVSYTHLRDIHQYFAVLTSMRSVGVMGDSRTYDYTLALRGVTTTDEYPDPNVLVQFLPEKSRLHPAECPIFLW